MFITSNPCNVRHAVSNEKKPIPGFVSRLMRTMVLFDEIVKIFALPEFTRDGKNPCCLQFLERFRVCRVFVDCDHARSHRMEGPDSFPEKALGSWLCKFWNYVSENVVIPWSIRFL